MRSSGFTLFELLAVIVLIGLVLSSGVSKIGLETERARMLRVVSDFVALDQEARLLARSGGTVRIFLKDESEKVRGIGGSDPETIVLRREATAEKLAGLEIPKGFSIQVNTRQDEARSPVTTLRIGKDGRSLDYEVAISLGDLQKKLRVDGLTGVLHEVVGTSP